MNLKMFYTIFFIFSIPSFLFDEFLKKYIKIFIFFFSIIGVYIYKEQLKKKKFF